MNSINCGAVLAYIDAGSGAMLLQWLIAAIVGSGFYFRRAIARLFGKKDKKTEPKNGSQKESDPNVSHEQ